MYRDETLGCVDCGRQFAFTTGEQEFFAMKGFTNKPTRCPDCRAVRKARQPQTASSSTPSRDVPGNVQSMRATGGASVPAAQ